MSDVGIVYAHYRCATATKAGSKDWAIAVTANGELVVRHCATGSSARRLVIPPKHFRESDAIAEKMRREREQLNQGYVRVGEAVVKRGHLEALMPATVTANDGAE